MNTVEHFAEDLAYWKHWVEHEEAALASCPYETKPYLEKRIAVGKRNIMEIEKALEVLNE